jgi:hypothetical protein
MGGDKHPQWHSIHLRLEASSPEPISRDGASNESGLTMYTAHLAKRIRY